VRGRSFSILILAWLAALGGACTYGHQEAESGAFQPLVFPGEARLGASAFMVIDSNYFQIGDQLEHYDLHRDRVKIVVQGNLGTAEATVRSVFALESGRATDDAEARRNAWVMVAFFDLPDESDGIFTPPYPVHAPLHLLIDDVEQPALEGVIWVVGEGGQPTSMDAQPLLPLLEDALEPGTTVRLRARGDGADGFQDGWNIGGVSLEIEYNPSCLANPRAFVGSDAVKAGVTTGTPFASLDNPGRSAVKIVLSQPAGLQLPIGSVVDATRLGNGPILDIAFDRVLPSSCIQPLSSYFWIHSLKVRDVDGTLRASRPGASETSFDGSDFFHVHYVDPDRPS
jgi:hypothetical protein